jgi:hypothetical protein
MPPIINHQQPFTQPVSAMRKNALQALCRHFELDDEGPVITLRQRLKVFLQEHHEQLEDNPIYSRLYPRRGRQILQPVNDHNGDDNDQDHGSQHSVPGTPALTNNSDWHGIHQPGDDNDNIDNIINPPPSVSSRHPSATPPLIRTPEPEEAPFPQSEQERHRSLSLSTYNLFSPFFSGTPSSLIPRSHLETT